MLVLDHKEKYMCRGILYLLH